MVTLHLTVNAPVATTIDASVCKGGTYYGNGFFVQTKGLAPDTYTYTLNLSTAAGCDSTVTLNLTVDQAIETSLSGSVTIGELYAADGFIVDASTLTVGTYTYTQTIYTADGCDSNVTLTLTVNNLAQTTTLYDTVCKEDTWYIENGFTINVGGSADGTYTHTRIIGDSTVNLYLTVASAKATDLYADVCKGEPYSGHGFSITGAQTQNAGVSDFTQSLTTAMGCDSTVTLHLTVNTPAAVTLNEAVCQGGTYYGHGKRE